MKCPICGQRKGKRACPAKDAQICPQCCGEKRVLEIDCPENCEFLSVGRSHEVHSQRMRQFQTSDPATEAKQRRAFSEFRHFTSNLERRIAQERQSSRDLGDRNVVEALDLLLATLRTEESGILYERTSADFRTDVLRRSLKEVIDIFREPKDETVDRLRLGEVIECLEVVRGLASSHMDARASKLSYVDFLARMLPSGRRIDRRGPSLIIPGR